MRITARTGSHNSSHFQDTIWIPWGSWSGWSVWFPGVSVLSTVFSAWLSGLLPRIKRGNVKIIQLVIHNDVAQLQCPPDIFALCESDKQSLNKARYKLPLMWWRFSALFWKPVSRLLLNIFWPCTPCLVFDVYNKKSITNQINVHLTSAI